MLNLCVCVLSLQSLFFSMLAEKTPKNYSGKCQASTKVARVIHESLLAEVVCASTRKHPMSSCLSQFAAFKEISWHST